MSTRENAPVLVATGITKTLGQGAGQVVAVKGVDISLVPGQLTLLMGPSGSGKTTLLSILGCILTATSGKIVIDGTDVGGLSVEALAKLRRTHIGYIFQSYNLFPTLNALENVRIALDVAGQSGIAAVRKAEQALKDVGLGHKLHSYPANLSGGEKQRVAVARAIASAPSIVLADEPTAALDSENGHGVMKLLSEIAKTQNRSILVVTHDPRTLGYADRVIRIEDGLIIGEENRKAEPERGQRKSITGPSAGADGAATRGDPVTKPLKPVRAGAVLAPVVSLLDGIPNGRRAKRRRKNSSKAAAASARPGNVR